MELALEVKFHLDFNWVTRPWRWTLTNGCDVKTYFRGVQYYSISTITRTYRRMCTGLIRGRIHAGRRRRCRRPSLWSLKSQALAGRHVSIRTPPPRQYPWWWNSFHACSKLGKALWSSELCGWKFRQLMTWCRFCRFLCRQDGYEWTWRLLAFLSIRMNREN